MMLLNMDIQILQKKRVKKKEIREIPIPTKRKKKRNLRTNRHPVLPKHRIVMLLIPIRKHTRKKNPPHQKRERQKLQTKKDTESPKAKKDTEKPGKAGEESSSSSSTANDAESESLNGNQSSEAVGNQKAAFDPDMSNDMEEEVKAAMKQAADAANARSRNDINHICDKRVHEKSVIQKEVKDLDAPITPEEMKDICNFRE